MNADPGHAPDPSSNHYYRALGGGRYAPTEHAQGAWSENEQHMAPVSGLLVHALERHDGGAAGRPLAWSRITFDILGMIHLDETTVTTRTLRPGRTIELVEATASAGGREVVRATAWRLITGDTGAVAVARGDRLVDPDTLESWDGMLRWGGHFLRSLDFRAIGEPRPGRGQVWVRSNCELVDGEESTSFARWAGTLDTANGIACAQDPKEWMFPNVDLTLHLHRQPVGLWAGLDTTVSWGPTGQGLTSSVVHDLHGPVGAVAQSLTLRPQP